MLHGGIKRMNIKLCLKAARVNAGLSQKQAADKLNIGVSTLQGYESGKRYPRLDTLEQMQKVYGVSISYFTSMPTGLSTAPDASQGD